MLLCRGAALALLIVLLMAGCARREAPVVLATTTSMGSSGLLDHVLSGYSAGEVRSLLVGSGRALEMLASGTADVVISHAPALEAEALRAHPQWWYRKILFNYFVIVGPGDDPAGAGEAADAAEAMRRIATSTATFLSRGDESGTHERERQLWSAAGAAPEPGRLVIAGAGMGQTLRIADGTGAYTLADQGTFEALSGSVGLVVLFEGDERLVNTYAVIADRRNERGAAFATWLSGGGGRELMRQALDDGRVSGLSLWPAGSESATPAARPR